MPTKSPLDAILADAYAAKVLHQGSVTAVSTRLKAALADPAVLTAAKAEFNRAKSVSPRRCFASGVTADFLRSVLNEFTASAPRAAASTVSAPPPTPTPAPVSAPSSLPLTPPKETDDMTSKLKGLADLAKTAIADVEGRAESAMDKLNKAQAHAHFGLDKVDGVTAEIEKAATDIENFANQVTNGPPA